MRISQRAEARGSSPGPRPSRGPVRNRDAELLPAPRTSFPEEAGRGGRGRRRCLRRQCRRIAPRAVVIVIVIVVGCSRPARGRRRARRRHAPGPPRADARQHGPGGPRQPARRRSTARHRHDARHRRRPILRRGERVHPPAILRRGGMRQRARRDVDTPRGGRREEHRALAPARRRRQVPSRRRRNRNSTSQTSQTETPTTAFASRGSTGGTCGRARRSTTAGWAAKGTAWARGCPHPAERTRRRGWTRTRDGKTTAG